MANLADSVCVCCKEPIVGGWHACKCCKAAVHGAILCDKQWRAAAAMARCSWSAMGSTRVDGWLGLGASENSGSGHRSHKKLKTISSNLAANIAPEETR